jgi:hypothetical protein
MDNDELVRRLNALKEELRWVEDWFDDAEDRATILRAFYVVEELYESRLAVAESR